MKRVIYTCLVGDYDQLRQPLAISPQYDYICFTDNPSFKRNGVWRLEEIPFQNDNNLIRSRYVKLLPHKVLKNYDYSIWIDANICICNSDFYDYLDKQINDNSLVSQVPHLLNNCVYDEIRRAFYVGKVNWHDAYSSFHHLKQEGFPRKMGLFENNILFRRHNDPQMKQISECWWKEFCLYAKRDQFSLVYVYWKYNVWPTLLFGPENNTRNISCLEYHYHPSVMNEISRKESYLLKLLRGMKKKALMSLFLR